MKAQGVPVTMQELFDQVVALSDLLTAANDRIAAMESASAGLGLEWAGGGRIGCARWAVRCVRIRCYSSLVSPPFFLFWEWVVV